MNFQFRLATLEEFPDILDIINQAKARRKADGSNQWQDGYPNIETIESDYYKKAGYVLVNEINELVGYSAVLLNDEPAYLNIEGQWLSNNEFIVIHRVAIHDNFLGKGLAKMIFRKIEELAISKNVYSIKVDTNFDNLAMLHIFNKLDYQYCGQVYFRGSARRAYEKTLK
jgi:GNAT superfamily N-acetyltransferase